MQTNKYSEHLKWDWTKLNSELAIEHGVTRERVRQIRNKLNIPKVRNWVRRPEGYKYPSKPMTEEQKKKHEERRKRYIAKLDSMGYVYCSFHTTPEIRTALRKYYNELKSKSV